MNTALQLVIKEMRKSELWTSSSNYNNSQRRIDQHTSALLQSCKSASMNAEHGDNTLLEQRKHTITVCVNEMHATVLSADGRQKLEAST